MDTTDRLSFQTSDLHLAAFCLASGAKIESLTRQGRRVTFVFSDPEGRLLELSREYMAGRATIDARRFVAALEDAKTLIFQAGSP